MDGGGWVVRVNQPLTPHFTERVGGGWDRGHVPKVLSGALGVWDLFSIMR